MPNCGWLLVLGIVTILAGVLLMAAPGLTTVAVTIFIGWVLVVLGAGGIVVGLKSVRPSRRWGDTALGVLTVLVGLYALVFPISGAVSLTIVVTAWFLARGIMELAAAIAGQGGRLRGYLLFSALLDIVLGILLFVNLPFPAVQFIGLAVGISLVVSGMLTVLGAIGIRRGGAISPSPRTR